MHTKDTPENPEVESDPPPPEQEIDKAAAYRLAEELLSEQAFLNGIAGGVIAAVISAGIWGGIAVGTGYSYSLVAIGVGIFVGWLVQKMGKGLDVKFSIVASVFAIVGCAFGNVAAAMFFAMSDEGLAFSEVAWVIFSPQIIFEILSDTLQPMDLLFWLVAVAAAWQTAKRKLTEEQAIALYVYEHRPEGQAIIS